MTLEEFNQMVTEASQKAHLFVANSVGTPSRIRSVALRIDDDGVLSVVLYTERMQHRVPTDEAKEMQAAMAAMRELFEREPNLKNSLSEFDGFFVHWDEITDAMAAAGDEYTEWDCSPLELITRLIDERDELRATVDEIRNTPDVASESELESEDDER